MADEDDASGAEPPHQSGDSPQKTPPDRASEPEASDEHSNSTGIGRRLLEVWRNPAYRFVLLFLPCLGAVSIGYPLFVRHYNFVVQWFILLTAKLEWALFSMVGADTRVNDKVVFLDHFAVKIIDECTGIYEMLIFAAAVLAFPTGWLRKGVGIFLGCPMIYIFNVLRIAALMVVGRYWPSAFDFMHLYFWQATMIVMITSVWLLWILFVVRDREEKIGPPNPA